MASFDVIGTTVYAQSTGVGRQFTELELMQSLRYQIPSLIGADPDDYRTTREFAFQSGRLTFVVALGQKRDRCLWYSVMAVGATAKPPPEYITVAKAVGAEALQKSCDEGDFEE